VVAAHTLRLSAALFEAGRRHELVLLPKETHMARSETVAENILLLQLDFLRRSLGLDGGEGA
jgi:dipeptidyl-peptidase 4